MRKRWITLAAAALWSVVAGDARAAVEYMVTDLGTLPVTSGSTSMAYGVNSSGQVVGQSLTSVSGQKTDHAFLYSSGTMTDLGTLATSQTLSSEAYGINDSGQVVGASDTNGAYDHAFLATVSSGTVTRIDLGTLPGFNASGAQGINNSGQIVASATSPTAGNTTSSGEAFLATVVSGSVTRTGLGDLGGGFSEAFAISNSGQITGDSINSAGADDAFLATVVSGSVTMTDLGNLDGGPSNPNGFSQGLAVNNKGQVVGTSSPDGITTHAFLFSGGTMTDLGTLPGFTSNSTANGINASGLIVGVSTNSSGGMNAFLDSGGSMQNLNSLISTSSGWTLQDATAINNNGQIVGYGTNPSGQTDAFLLTPTPEPGTLALLAAGAIALAGYGWRRRRLARSAAQPPAFDRSQDDAPAILAFPSQRSHAANASRRAA